MSAQEMELKHALAEMDKELKKAGISRRDALKIFGLGGAALTLPVASTQAKASSSAKGRIVIIGAGLGGITVAARLSNALKNPDITIIDGGDKIDYQPGYTLVASGVYDGDDVVYDRAGLIPSGVKWIKEYVSEIDADGNSVTTSSGTKIPYDFLVVATGLVTDYSMIKGLDKDMVGSNGIASIYTLPTARKAFPQIKEFVNKGGVGLFSDPATPIKCGGAPKKIQFLIDDYARKEGKRDKIRTIFLPNGGSMFGVKEYATLIENLYKEKGMEYKLKHNLVSIDAQAKKATFLHSYTEKGKFDEILGEHEMINKSEEVVLDYDFIHVTPPMRAPTMVKDSVLSWKKGSAAAGGWLELTKETLQHPVYKNVFGIGDVAGIPMGKTGGSVRKQAPILVENLISVMEGKEPSAKYGGYTVCPLIVDFGRVAMLEFDWSATPTPSLPFDPLQPRWIYWVMKVYMLKPMTMIAMLKGYA
ncbi:MAG: NAD(P)/FAD-dependent oxidoreductase [Wolinella sp.]